MDVQEKVRQILARQAKLLSVEQVAELLNCSTRHVYRLKDRGLMPAPVRLGNLVRWQIDEIHKWIESGCPQVKQ